MEAKAIEYIEREPLLEYAVCGNSRAIGFVPVRFIMDALAKDVDPAKTARWVNATYRKGGTIKVGIKCSSCKQQPKDRITESEFCPNCGAQMVNGQPEYDASADCADLIARTTGGQENRTDSRTELKEIDCRRVCGAEKATRI